MRLLQFTATAAEIAKARAAMLADREREGIHTAYVHCDRCHQTFEGTGFSDGQAQGQALRDWAAHRIAAHGSEGMAS